MSPVRSDDPLRRVTLNLYESDCTWFERTYGRGWTERIRQHIHGEVQKRQDHYSQLSETQLHEASNNKTFRRTLGDLSDD